MTSKKKPAKGKAKKPLTPKQKKLIALLPKVASGEMKTETAMKQAGYSETTAKQQSKVMGGVRKSSVMQEALRKAGVTEAMLARKIAKGLRATRFFSANFKLHEVDDYNAQHNYVKTAAELLDAFPAKKSLTAEVSPEELLAQEEQEATYAPWGDAAEDKA